MKLTRADSGRKGGMTTLRRYGREQLAYWGKLGGRPHSPTYQDISSRRQLLEQNNDHKQKEVITGPPGNLKGLKKQYAARYGSSGDNETQEAGIAQATTLGHSLPERNAV